MKEGGESDENGKTEEDRGETAGSGRERWTDREKERSHQLSVRNRKRKCEVTGEGKLKVNV